MEYSNVIEFWFGLSQEAQFKSDPKMDEHIRTKFLSVLEAARNCELSSWRSTPLGRLGEIIVLDQFSRNIYRNTPLAFAQDPQALTLAQEMILLKADAALNIDQKRFCYMPFMHSESKSIHDEAMKLYSEKGLEDAYDFEMKHKKIIDRFGRYPHRNEILGRKSTPEEIEFLKGPGSSF